MQSSACGPAAILLIGDELLTGKIRDENGHFLARMLRRRGIPLCELTIVGDRIDDIGGALLRLASKARLVFTSGGVGPTHDDKTLEAIAKATRRPLERNAKMEQTLRAHYRERITDVALSMADLPAGTTLCAPEGWPVMRLDLTEPVPTTGPTTGPTTVYVLPGVPALLRAKVEHLEAIEGELPMGEGWHVALLHTDLDESSLTPFLDAVVEAFPDVEIGSYPRWSRDDGGKVTFQVRVTFEAPSADAQSAEAARDQLRAALPTDRLVEPHNPL